MIREDDPAYWDEYGGAATAVPPFPDPPPLPAPKLFVVEGERRVAIPKKGLRRLALVLLCLLAANHARAESSLYIDVLPAPSLGTFGAVDPSATVAWINHTESDDEVIFDWPEIEKRVAACRPNCFDTWDAVAEMLLSARDGTWKGVGK